MADLKFLDMQGLTTYDGKIKQYLADKDTEAKAAAIAESKITIDTDSVTDGMLKSYAIKQNGTTVATIDIPKDLVVKSGKVVTNPDDSHTGTFIELTLANDDTTKIYIDVSKLIDPIYKAKAEATQVQLTVDAETREISAVIVAGGVGTNELKDSAVTLTKLAEGVQTSLGKTDSAVQKVEASETNGSISVDGKDVAVAGLKSAANSEADAFDAAGTAETKVSALEAGQVTTNKNDIAQIKGQIETLESETPTAITNEDILGLFDGE